MKASISIAAIYACLAECRSTGLVLDSIQEHLPHQHELPTYAESSNSNQYAFKADTPLQHGKTITPQSYSIPLEWSAFVFTTIMALGTPPQPFNAAVDMTYRIPMGLSSDCDNWTCDEEAHWVYNSSESSTYVPIGKKHHVTYGGAEYPGHLSQDTLHLTGLRVENQTFHEATDVEPRGWDWAWDMYDGLLSLARPLDKSDSKSPSSLLENIVSQGHLDSNIISLKVPSWEMYDLKYGGEIRFGRIDESYSHSDFTYVPITHETKDPVLKTAWTVDVSDVELEGLIYESLRGFSAVVNVATPSIALPGYVINDLVTLLGAGEVEDYEGEFWSVPCKNKDTMPDFTISLSGTTFTLTPDEYTKRFENWDGTITCMLAFAPVENYFVEEARHPWSISGIPQKPAIILGAWFLEKFYTVIDMDHSRIGFAPLKEELELRHGR